jgi:hypothetical protein
MKVFLEVILRQPGDGADWALSTKRPSLRLCGSA